MLDWSVTEDVDGPESTPPTPTPPRGHRRALILALGLAAVAALGVWAATTLQGEARETRAAEWLQRHPPPDPLPGLRPVGLPEVRAVTGRPDGGLQVSAVYAYEGVDGAPLRFRLERAFTHTGDVEPASTSVTATLEVSSHLRVVYEPGDSTLVVDELAPVLDRVIDEACRQWGCAAEVRLIVDLTGEVQPPAVAAAPNESLPANRVFAYARSFVVRRDTLAVPRPSTGGAPADSLTRDYWRAAVADAALVQLALRLRNSDGPNGMAFVPSLPHHAFFYALVLRQAARSGLEDAAWLRSTHAPPPGLNAGELWRSQVRVDHGPLADELELRAAHAVLTPLIGDDDAFERALFNTLDPELPLADWLAGALATTGRPAADSIRLLAGDSTLDDLRALASVEAEDPGWIALLDCQEGQWIWRQTGARFPLGFSRMALAPVQVVGARSTLAGLDLAVRLGDRVALRAARSGAVEWVAGARVPSALNFAGWIGANAAYFVSAAGQIGTDLEVVSPQRPADVLARLTDVYRVAPAPVGDAAFVVSTAGNTDGLLDGSGLVRLIVPLAGLDIPFAVGYAPAWSPEGQRAAVLLAPNAETDWGSGLSVGLLPSVTEPDFAFEVWSPGREGLAPQAGPFAGRIAWSPRGDRIAVAARVRRPDDGETAYGVWLLQPGRDGPALPNVPVRLDVPTTTTDVTDLAFSADGRFLAIAAEVVGVSQLLWFATDDGRHVATAERSWTFAWAPHGHAMITLGEDGARLYNDPMLPPQVLPGSTCRSVLWNPQAQP